MIKYVNEENFNDEVLKSRSVVLVDFFATWCGPCSMLNPILEKIENTTSDFKIVKIDVDKSRNLALDYEIEAVPTLLIFKEAEIVDRIEGLASQSEIIDKVLKYK